MMKAVLRFLFVGASLLLVAGPAFADDPQVTFDPVMLQLTPLDTYILYNTGTFTAAWTDCSGAAAINPAYSSYQGCMIILNDTGYAITDLNFSFTVNSYTTQVSCNSLDQFLSINNCPNNPNVTLDLGSQVNFDFYGGTPVPNLAVFILGENGVSDPNNNFPIDISVPTHDPSTVVLLATGLGLLGLCAMRRRAGHLLAD